MEDNKIESGSKIAIINDKQFCSTLAEVMADVTVEFDLDGPMVLLLSVVGSKLMQALFCKDEAKEKEDGD